MRKQWLKSEGLKDERRGRYGAVAGAAVKSTQNTPEPRYPPGSSYAGSRCFSRQLEEHPFFFFFFFSFGFPANEHDWLFTRNAKSRLLSHKGLRTRGQ